MAFEGCHKFGYLTGEVLRHTPRNPQERIWKGEDSLVQSLLINSMEPQIGKPLLYVATARDIWDSSEVIFKEAKCILPLYFV